MLSERVAESDFIGIVVTESREEFIVDGFAIGGWSIRVERVLKGRAATMLAVDGGGWGSSPGCCEQGARYLLFSKRGYHVFDPGAGSDPPPVGTDVFVSPVDGKFGTLRVVEDRVEWPATPGLTADPDGRVALALATRLVRRELDTPMPSEEVLDRLEASIELPAGAHRLEEYSRIYASDSAAGTIVGFLMRDVGGRSSRRIWEMPRVFDGGCDVVRLEYVVADDRFHWVACNEASPD
ncbi:hypothetical protein [Arenimonas composti]|uniref:hypothetical protein n=1 Tax=Arenimonas composti TaxID=370776 RepID=UPI0012B64DA4|nr:hypothetical protein [Arenimonas composti]